MARPGADEENNVAALPLVQNLGVAFLGQLARVALEPRDQVLAPAMVDVGIGFLVIPKMRWISLGVRLSIFMQFFLQVDARIAKSANDQVGADADIFRNIPAGVIDNDIFLAI